VRLAVRGGLVVTERETRRADVIVAGERIEAVLDPGAGAAEEEIAAHGLLVLPGVVDAHVHVNEPGRAEWEGWRAATRGAAAGGVTTVADMPLNSLPPTLDGAAFDAKRAFAEREAIVDFALWGGLVGDDPAPLRELRGRGVVGVKAFMCPSGVDEFAHLDPDALEPALHAAAAAGLLVAVHAEDEDAVAHATRELRAAGRRDPAAWEPSRPIPAEVRAIECLGRAARIGGATVHVVHASNAGAVDAAARCRIAGARMTIETCPHYLTFDASDLGRIGPPLKCAPPVRTSAERERLWRSVREGAVDLVASDHSPCPRELKERGDIWDVWGGVAGVQFTLAALLTEGVHRRGLGESALARLLAGAPARLLGIADRKGAIRAGLDADLALVDPEREWTVTARELEARNGVSAYLGRRFRGKVVRTIVRGRTVYRDGEVVADGGAARFIAREGSS